MWDCDKETNKCLVHQNLTKAVGRSKIPDQPKEKEKVFMKIYSNISLCSNPLTPSLNDQIAAPGLEG